MTLSFSQKFADKSPTYFVEKIWQGIGAQLSNEQVNYYFYDHLLEKHYEWNADFMENCPPKIHTIRADEKNRWREGMDIHFVINNRTKKRFQFAPILPVKSIQKFRVSWDEGIVHVYIDDILFYTDISYHSRFIEFHKQMQKLAENDGFKDIQSFLNWFSEDFEGKIIHWTDFSY